jgi:hypothetical protein
MEVVKIPSRPESERLSERWVRTVWHEVTDRMLIAGPWSTPASVEAQVCG